MRKVLEQFPYQQGEEDKVDHSQAEYFKFKGNDVLMVRVLNNLMSNAFEQIRENGCGTITVTTGEDEHYNYLYFKDTAGGASPEQVEKLFDSYYTTKSEGTGVGLAFCKKVMNDFGGDITAESKQGEWMCFTLRFPKIVGESHG